VAGQPIAQKRGGATREDPVRVSLEIELQEEVLGHELEELVERERVLISRVPVAVAKAGGDELLGGALLRPPVERRPER
jgi:hypothetical protein